MTVILTLVSSNGNQNYVICDRSCYLKASNVDSEYLFECLSYLSIIWVIRYF